MICFITLENVTMPPALSLQLYNDDTSVCSQVSTIDAAPLGVSSCNIIIQV